MSTPALSATCGATVQLSSESKVICYIEHSHDMYIPNSLIAVCENGDANLTTDSTVHALCYNEVWYDVVVPIGNTTSTEGANEEMSVAGDQSSVALSAALGSLFGVSVLALITVLAISVVLVARNSRKNRGVTPTG